MEQEEKMDAGCYCAEVAWQETTLIAVPIQAPLSGITTEANSIGSALCLIWSRRRASPPL